ncbi:ABC transporter permease, partial [Streptomyces sp. NPDC045369]
MTETGTRPAEAAVRPVPKPAARRAGALAARAAAVLAKRVLMLVVLLALVFAAIELLPGDAATATSERGEGAAGVAAPPPRRGRDPPGWVRVWVRLTALATRRQGTS